MVTFSDEFVGDVLNLFFYLFHFVFGYRFVLELLDFVHYVAACVADVDLAVLHFDFGGLG